MRRTITQFLVLLPALVVLTACGRNNVSTISSPAKQAVEPPKRDVRSTEKPIAPLTLAVPAAMPDKLNGEDLKSIDEPSLQGLARVFMSRQNYSSAAACQYWYVQKSKTGQYDLACFLARIGQTDPAFYWLQLAASEEGVDSTHAERDEDLVSLRSDPRWAKVRQYLLDCNSYFESAPISRTVVLVPKGYRKGTAIPAVLWMHGLGSRPDDFINHDGQKYADLLNVALIGVSGTKAKGPRSFVWAEDPDSDAKRLRDALAEVSDRVTVKEGQVITFGFSQGAQAGLEVAARYPQEYAGSIVLSPGASYHLDHVVQPSPLLAKRAFVVSCGAKEHPGNVQLAARDANWLRQAKAEVIHKPYPGVADHSFPADFDQRFPEWVIFILRKRAD